MQNINSITPIYTHTVSDFPITNHQSPVTSHQSPITNPQSRMCIV
ncbi:MAG: hypothetical protein ACKO9Y_18755 [Sphaerospermopsis kisseleviana]